MVSGSMMVPFDQLPNSQVMYADTEHGCESSKRLLCDSKHAVPDEHIT